MRGLFFAVLFPLSLPLAACVAPVDDADEAVESAAESIKGALPADAYPEAVIIDAARGGEVTPWCSGALIAPRVVLTAARCAQSYDRLVVRAPFAYGAEAWGRYAAVYDYPASDSVRSDAHDVGLIFLDRPIYLNSYPELAGWPLADGDQVVSVGRVQDGETGSATAYVSDPLAVAGAASHGYPYDYAISAVTEYADYGGPAYLPRSHTIVAVNAGSADGASLLARVDGLTGWIRQQVLQYGNGDRGYPNGPGYPGYPPGGGHGNGDGHGHGDGHGNGPGWPPGGGHGDGDGHGNGPGWPPGGGHGDGDGHGHGNGGGHGDGHGGGGGQGDGDHHHHH